MSQVVVTDYPFDSLDIETEILRPLGCRIVANKIIPAAAELAQLVAEADQVMTVFAPLTAPVIAAMRRAKAIVRYGVGVDNVDIEAARARAIPVCNVPDYCMDEVADHALALMLAVTRQVVVQCNSLRSGKWGLVGPPASMKSLADLVIGVVGCGRIGCEVVRRLLGFKCRVLVYDPIVEPAEVSRLGGKPATLDELLAASDVVTLHCPANAQTRHLLNRDTLSRMKTGAILINVARGALIDGEALIEWLERGRLAGAGLDVFDPEPLPAGSPLLSMPNVVVSAHVAAVSAKAIRKLRETAATIVAMSIQGEPLPNIVNGVG
jgi:D-3-phosphoglycerate dehydrogenase